MVAPREYSFTYGTTTIPGTFSGVDVSLHDVHRISRTPTDFSVEMTVLLKGAPEISNFAGAVTALESALSQPDRLVLITATDAGGSGSLLDLDPSNFESFNVVASIDKAGTPEIDSARSRLYTVTVEGEVPWVIDSPGAGRQGLREFSYDLEFTASRRQTLTLNGEYTGQSGGVSALAQYNANIEALYTSIIGALTGNWPEPDQPISERQSPDRIFGVLGFSRQYKELIKEESLAAVDSVVILDQSLKIRRTKNVPENSSPEVNGVRSETVTAVYSCSVDHTQRTDLLVLYEQSILGFIEDNVNAATTGTSRLVREDLTLDPVENIIEAELEFIGQIATDFDQLNVLVDTSADYGRIISKTWPKDQGQVNADLVPTPAYVFQGPKTIQQTITTTYTRVGKFPAPNIRKGGQLGLSSTIPQFRAAATAAQEAKTGTIQVVKLSGTRSHTNRAEGDASAGSLINYTDETVVEVIEVIGVPTQ